MKAYVVRLDAEQRHPGEIVGFFFADDLDELCKLVDECCETKGCEALELGSGGFYWAASSDYVLPIEPSETPPALPGDGTMTEAWLEALCTEGEWRSLARANIEGAEFY